MILHISTLIAGWDDFGDFFCRITFLVNDETFFFDETFFITFENRKLFMIFD